MTNSLRCVVAFGIALVALPASGAITYVDAVANTNGSDGNTTLNGASVILFDSTLGGSGNVTTDSNAADDLWRYREQAQLNGGQAWEGFHLEEPEPLITTLTLAPGIYDLFGLFWSGAGSSFVAEFRVGTTGPYSFFDAGSLSTLTANDGSDFDNEVNVRWPVGFADLRIASLGQFSINNSVDIFVKNRLQPELPQDQDARTVYDGVGYEFVGPVSTTPGDFDGDGDVDGADFVVWQTNFPKADGGTLDTGDADGDGDVDGADFVVWQTNFPFTPSSSVSSVPEPYSVVLATVGGMFLVFGQYRKRRNRHTA